MVVDTTYPDKKITRQINEAVGKSFSWQERWKMGGIGSPRLRIHAISDEYRQYMKADHYISNLNIELRPNGILLHFRHKLQTYSWIMPFDQLTLGGDSLLELSCDNKFIHLERPEKKFLDKLKLVRAARA